MDLLHTAPIVADILAFALAMQLMYKTRDWRLSFLAAMAVLVALNQWTEIDFAGNLGVAGQTAFRLSEITNLAVSVTVLLSVFFVGRLIEHARTHAGELQMSEARFRSLFDDTPVMMYSADADGRLIDVNRHWLEVMGYARDEVLGAAVTNFLTSESWRRVGGVSVPEFHRGGDTSNVPFSLTTKDGDIIEVLFSSVAEKDEHGAFLSSRSVMIDVTKQHVAETYLLEAMESNPDGIAIYGADDRLMHFNQTYRTGLSPDLSEVIKVGASFEEILRAAAHINPVADPGKDLEADIAARLKRHRQGDSSFDVEMKDDRWFLFNERRMPGGGTVSTRSDITERKRAEEALQESEQRLRTMIENVPGVVFRRILHADGSVTFPFLSAHYFKLLGIDSEAAMNDPQVILKRLHPDDRAGWMAAWSKSAKSHASFDREVRISRTAKDMRWFRVRAVPQRLPNGDILWDAIGIDVTEEKRAAEIRDRMFAALENLSEGVALFGPDDRLVYTNQRYIEFNEEGGSVVKPGKTFEQIVRRNVRLGRIPEAIGREEEWIAERMESHRNLPYTAERKVGSRWLDIREAALPDGSTVLLNIDITKQKRANEIRDSLFAALENLTDGVALFGPDDRLLFANRRMVELNEQGGSALKLGRSFEEITRVNMALGRFPEAKGREEKWIAKRMKEHRNPPYAAVRKVGSYWQDIREEALPDGSVIYLVADVTARRQAEDTNRKNQEQLSLITENIPALISYIGRDERFRFANSAYGKSFGASQRKIEGMSLKEYWGAKSYATFSGNVKRVLAGETVNFENTLPAKDGGMRHVAVTYVPHFVDGKVEAFFSLATASPNRW